MTMEMEMKKFKYMLDIDTVRNSSQKLGVLRGGFRGLGVQKTPRCPAG